jgi:hypothetical protein
MNEITIWQAEHSSNIRQFWILSSLVRAHSILLAARFPVSFRLRLRSREIQAFLKDKHVPFSAVSLSWHSSTESGRLVNSCWSIFVQFDPIVIGNTE